MKKISIIVPCYNEQDALPEFYEEIQKVRSLLLNYSFEFVFVDDGSDDNTLPLLKDLAAKNSEVTYLSFSRNFGKEAAMYAGFCNVSGDYVAIMDADLQDPPALLPKMLDIIETGNYSCVAARRISRKGEPPVRSWFAKLFYKIINRISDAEIMDGARDFRLMKKEMADALVAMPEYNRFSKGIFGWIGFKTYWLPYENIARVTGKTKWHFWKLFKYAVEGIIDFSEVPLNMASWFGLVMSVISFIFLIVIIIRRIIFGDPVAGWASLICVIIFIGGLQLFSIGIIGKYVAKNYTETKKRPHYIITETSRPQIKKIN